MRAAVFVAGVALVATQALAGTVYTQDFESALGSEWSGVTTLESVQGLSGLGGGASGNTFAGSLLYNPTGGVAGNNSAGANGQATTLTLQGLPSHSTLSISFLLAVIDSWDGANGAPAPDYFTIRVDGVLVFQQTFAIQSGSPGLLQSTPGDHQIAGTGTGNLGFYVYSDMAFDLAGALTQGDLGLGFGLGAIPHTASTAVIEFRAEGGGWQGNYGGTGFDEAWGMDELVIGVDGGPVIPLPHAGGMAMAGLGLLAMRRRRVIVH